MSREAIVELAGHALAAGKRLPLRVKLLAAAVTVLVAAVVILAVLRGAATAEFDAQGRLVQRGSVPEAARPGTYEVRYPQPYAALPELVWLTRPMQLRMIEERPRGFRFEIIRTAPHDLPPRWEARGEAAPK